MTRTLSTGFRGLEEAGNEIRDIAKVLDILALAARDDWDDRLPEAVRCTAEMVSERLGGLRDRLTQLTDEWQQERVASN